MNEGDVVQLWDTTYRFIKEIPNSGNKILLIKSGGEKGKWVDRKKVVHLWRHHGSFYTKLLK